jgi:small subunit ribosomal protein S15
MHKNETVRKFAHHEKDTGSPEVQIALLTARITTLTEHFKVNVKDFAGRRGMLRLVSRRRSLLDYLNSVSSERYTKILQQLGLRR